MLKFLVIKSFNQSRWESCKTIVDNLVNCYDQLSNNHFKIDYFFWNSNPIDLANHLKANKFDKLIFIDHSPSPANILNLVLNYLPLKSLPPTLIHSYGDFTYFSNEWLNVENKILGHEITFLSASKSQTDLIKSFLINPNNSKQAYFPLSDPKLIFDQEVRSTTRAKYNISEKEKIYIYTGRVSLQKNVDLLIESFIQNSPKDSALWIVGGFDDIGAPFMGARTNEGYLFHKINQLLEKTSRVKLFGFKNKTELYPLLMAADCFVSISLYHDEDFGVAPAEALATGLTASLSDWGGHSSFKTNFDSIKLYPVGITREGLNLNLSKLFKEEFTDNEIEKRQIRSEDFLQAYSPTSLANELKSLFAVKQTIFEGFNLNLTEYSKTFHHSEKFLKSIQDSVPPNDQGIYFNTYKSYLSLSVNNAHDDWKLADYHFDHFLCIQNEIPFKQNYHVDLIPYSNELYSSDLPTMLYKRMIGIGLNLNLSRYIEECSLRDGLIPLSLFLNFNKHFTVKKIFISAELNILIPENLLNRTGYYRTIPNNNCAVLPSKIILSPILDSLTTSRADIDQTLLEIYNSYTDHSKIEIYLLENNFTSELLQSQDLNNYLSSQLLKLFKNFKEISWREFRSLNSLNGFTFFEINNKKLLAETFTFNHALAKGAQTPVPKTLIAPTHSLNLSLNHKREFFNELPYPSSNKSAVNNSQVEQFIKRYPEWEN